MQGTFYKLVSLLDKEDLEGFFIVFNTFLAAIPYQTHKDAEAYYHSLLYLFLKTLGFKVEAEVSTHQGRIDMLLKTKEHIFLFEFKIDNSAQEALDQILEKKYHLPYKGDRRPLIAIGANFGYANTSRRRLGELSSYRYQQKT